MILGHVVSPKFERRRVLYWSEDTAAKTFDNGVQRVVRCLGRALSELGVDVVPVGWDGDRRLLRLLTTSEQEALGIGAVAETLAPRRGDWLLVPEIPARIIADGGDPIALAHAYELRAAVLVHDLIPLKHQEVYESGVVDFYRRCYRAFAAADLLLVTTRHVAADVAWHLQEATAGAPEIAVCALGADLPRIPRRSCKPVLPDDALNLLTVSRWEPRKNLPRLLRALGRLAGRPDLKSIHLSVVGRRGGFPAYEAEVVAHLARLPNVTVHTHIDDRQLVALHDAHHATIYPSFEEGFGLPILESLWLATPCLCHAGSAMAEIAPGGGTVMVDMLDEAAIADVLAGLAAAPDRLRALSDEAIARDLRSWDETARDVASSLGLLPRRRAAAEKSLLDLADVFW